MGQPPTVLVVDDSEVIRVMLSDFLRIWGYQPVTACDSASALELAGRGQVDAVFTDLQIGDKTGLDLCRELRAMSEHRGRPMPVWLMSGSDQMDYSVEATEAGAVGFFRKPFNPADIAQRLAAAVPNK